MFQVPVVLIEDIETIPGADKIELAKIGEYRSVIPKGQFKKGDKVTYIPEQAIVPDCILEKLNLKGKLGGSKGNRVKARRFRGVLSQGLVMTAHEKTPVGINVAKSLGIRKYEPRVPVSMTGEMSNIGSEFTLNYDIEHYKMHPNILQEGELVRVTEKIHGTCMQIGYIPGLNRTNLFYDGNLFVCSKGLGSKGMVFKNVEANQENVYVKAINKLLDSNDSFLAHLESIKSQNLTGFYLLGELYGRGIQDLSYDSSEHKLKFFDTANSEKKYLSAKDKTEFFENLGLDQVDTLYEGPFDKGVIDELSQGDTITGDAAHMREGIVITPLEHRSDKRIGRVILKHINDEYLLRDNATEFN